MKISTHAFGCLVAAVVTIVGAMEDGEKGNTVACEALPVTTPVVSDPVLDIAQSMREWMTNGGGFVNEKVEIRRRIPEDNTSPLGVFALQDVEEKELVFHVPHDLYIRLRDDEIVVTPIVDEKERIQKELKDYYDNTCMLAQRLMNETKKYRESPSSTRFEPYIRYLEETQPRGQLPATYSPQAKDLLRRIQGTRELESFVGASFLPRLDMVDWIDNHLVKKGCFDANDLDSYHSTAIAIQRGFDFDLVPVWDFVNHDVLERVNVKTNAIREEGGFRVWASRKILAGEEVLYSYNYCEDCLNDGDERGTPGMLEDFGFVEDYPQLWPFPDRLVQAKIIEKGEQSGRYEATFVVSNHEKGLHAPSWEDIDFFIHHLQRIRSLGIESKLELVESSYERATIARYYDSVLIALSSIIHRGLEVILGSEGSSIVSYDTA